jgi:hypothetical protein
MESASPISARGLEHLRAEARYRRERLDLYRAKAYGSRPTSPARLAELERDYELVAGRLRKALAERPDGPAQPF